MIRPKIWLLKGILIMFRNSGKLLFANFSTVWKVLLYYIIITLIGVGLVAPVFGSIGDILGRHDFYESLIELLSTFNIGNNILSSFATLSNVLATFAQCIVEYFVVYTANAIYLAVLFVIIMPFLYGLSSIAVGETLYGYMSSQAKVHFTGRLFSSIGKSVKYVLTKILIATPINLVLAFVVFQTFRLTTLQGPIKFAVPLFITIILCVLFAVRILIFSGWLPALIVNDCGVFEALKRGVKAVNRCFFKALSTLLVSIFIVFAVILLLGSIGLVIVFPIGLILFYVFSFVLFYEGHGMRYYVDGDTIITPKRLEEVDKFSKCKDLI